MTAETLAKLDLFARLMIVLGCLLVIVGESAGILPLVVGIPWLVAGLFGWGRPRIVPRGRTPSPLAPRDPDA